MTTPSSSITAPLPPVPPPPPPAVPSRSSPARIQRAGAWARRVASDHRWFLVASGVYLIVALVASRLELLAAPGQFPQGTNAVNQFLIYNQWKAYPLQTWYSPLTDWGQPVPTFTGPNLLYPGALLFGASSLVRLIEIGCLWLSGMTAYVLLRKLGAIPVGAGVAGFYFMLQAQTPQFFEGHVPSMISLAIAPIFLLAVWRFGGTLGLFWGLLLAGTLYLLASVGDLGILYFLLFFSIPLLAYSIVHHRTWRGLGRSQVFSVLCSVAVFILLMAPWWLPFLFGARPQYTTNITTAITPFGHQRSEPFDLAYAGISIENAFTRIFLLQPTYAVDYAATGALYFVVPALITLYVIVKRSLGRVLLYAGGFLAILISTGPNYPIVSNMNGFFYAYVPYFDYIPNFPSWLEITVIVYTVFVGWLVSDLVRWATKSPASTATARTQHWIFSETTRVGPRGVTYHWSSTRAGEAGRAFRRGRVSVLLVVVAVFTAFIVVSVAMENAETFTTPPQLFNYPAGYTTGLQYIASHPVRGGVLTVPFGNTVEFTPWGGVGVSAAAMASYYTGANAVVFQAGDPYSLVMDNFVSHAFSKVGYTDNITKYLAATNVQYITATDYPNWTYAGNVLGAPSNPRAQYLNLYRQAGLGPAVYSGGYQTVYEIAHPAGNLSFDPNYFVFFGNNSLVTEILNQPFYDGSQALINASQVPASELPLFIAHSAALIVAPGAVSTIPLADLSLAEQYGIPVISIAGAYDQVGTAGRLVSVPWNASNAAAVQPLVVNEPVSYGFNQSTLIAAGATGASGTLRASCPPGAQLTAVNGPTQRVAYYTNPATLFPLVNLSAGANVVQAEIHNPPPGYHYPGNATFNYTASGEAYVNWTLIPDNSTYQYLRFDIMNLAGAQGFTFTFANESGLPTQFQMQIQFDNTEVSMAGYPSSGVPGSHGVSYSFAFADATGPGLARFNPGVLEKVTRYIVGPLQTESASTLNVTGIAYMENVNGFPYENIPIPAFPLVGSNTTAVNATSQCRIDTLAYATGPIAPPAQSLEAFQGAQSNPLVMTATAGITGWGLLLAAQTYSPLWQLTVGGGTALNHVIVDLGLNAWLVNVAAGAKLMVRYLGQEYQTFGIVVAAIGLPLMAIILALTRSRRVRARLRLLPIATPSSTVPPRTPPSGPPPNPSTPPQPPVGAQGFVGPWIESPEGRDQPPSPIE
jgi:hypothetical protein